jgi:hypothetical protein
MRLTDLVQDPQKLGNMFLVRLVNLEQVQERWHFQIQLCQYSIPLAPAVCVGWP